MTWLCAPSRQSSMTAKTTKQQSRFVYPTSDNFLFARAAAVGLVLKCTQGAPIQAMDFRIPPLSLLFYLALTTQLFLYAQEKLLQTCHCQQCLQTDKRVNVPFQV